MNKEYRETSFQASTQCDSESKNKGESFGSAADTAGDLESGTSGKEVIESLPSGHNPAEYPMHDKTEATLPTLDPICGMTIDERTACHTERDGKTFYFCSDECLKTFLATIAGVKSDSKAGNRSH